MDVNFSKPKTITQEDIDLFSQNIKCSLPDDLKNFFLQFNGAQPESNIFPICENNESSINTLIPISEVMEERKYLDHIGNKVFPIAADSCGNYVVVDLDKESSVYFWDHEDPKSMIFLAKNIYEFLNTLKPFDPNNVEFDERQVESVWIDPEFLKGLQ